jgi:hypothetical protein
VPLGGEPVGFHVDDLDHRLDEALRTGADDM